MRKFLLLMFMLPYVLLVTVTQSAAQSNPPLLLCFPTVSKTQIVITYADYSDAELKGYHPAVVHVDQWNRQVDPAEVAPGNGRTWNPTT